MRTKYEHDRHECSSFTTRDECLAVACVPTTKLDTNRNSSTSAMFFDKPCNAHTYEMPCFRLSLAEFAGPSPRWAPPQTLGFLLAIRLKNPRPPETPPGQINPRAEKDATVARPQSGPFPTVFFSEKPPETSGKVVIFWKWVEKR